MATECSRILWVIINVMFCGPRSDGVITGPGHESGINPGGVAVCGSWNSLISLLRSLPVAMVHPSLVGHKKKDFMTW